MKKIDNFTNLYAVSKTLRFRAIPVGKTQEYIELRKLIEEDEERNIQYKSAKKIIDKYHKDFIERNLESISNLKNIDEYEKLFFKSARSDEDNMKLLLLEQALRDEIVEQFKKDPQFNKLDSESLISDILPNFLSTSEEKEIIASFKGFFTAFSGFNENRKNLYSNERKASSIAYRCINENLQRFLVNKRNFEKISQVLDDAIFDELTNEIGQNDYRIRDMFSIDIYSLLLSSKGISLYNTFLGGYTKETGEKIKGLNEYINLYNQQLSSGEKNKRLPILQLLYKQVMSDTESISFKISEYENNAELIEEIKQLIILIENELRKIEKLFGSLEFYISNGIYIENGTSIADIAKIVTGSWSTFIEKWNEEYDAIYIKKVPKDIEKYEEKRRKSFNAIASFSLSEIAKYLDRSDESVITCLKENIIENIIDVDKNTKSIKEWIATVVEKDFTSEDESAVNIIKNYLDSIKKIERIIKTFLGSGKETGRDELFYGELIPIVDIMRGVDGIYNRTRNYLTKKPYKKDKFKLYFQNPQILGGWDINKMYDYRSTILRKDGKYYLALIEKGNNKIFESDEATGNGYELLVYKQIPSAAKYISSKQIMPQNPPEDIKVILEKKKRGELSKDEITRFIDYSINDFLKTYPMLIDKNGNSYFDFKFKNPEEYSGMKEFFDDVDKQAYSVKFYNISEDYINKIMEEGRIYLFEIYCKDFSSYSHGKENLHTMYFRQLFEDNSFAVRLCGRSELFYRRASIESKVTHKANEPIRNKNCNNPKKESIFSYDLIKDKRYTVDQYEIHIPIELGSNRKDFKINDEVRFLLKNDENPYVIGIDRGERNLLYICVIDGSGNIIEQFSLNDIINKYNEIEIKTDYHQLLTYKEKERYNARQTWKTIENIKELKSGYISQVINKINQLVLKYDAIVAMEDLNSGFKNSRVKVEKQVYQKFEKALIDKLNYLCDKKIPMGEKGSVSCGYQLANRFKSFRSMGLQNGFIFYIPAWLTSKIDPVTGFVDLIKPKYTTKDAARDLIYRFDEITFDKSKNMFCFKFNYDNFDRASADSRKNWVIYSNGSRIRTYRNSNKNSKFDNEEIILTEEFIHLFKKYDIDYLNGDLRGIMCSQTEKDFYYSFISLLKLVLQMRNSVTGTAIDYLISPVMNKKGEFYDSRYSTDNLPKDADANGAYNIARKALWAINMFKDTSDDKLAKAKISISNKEWLEYAQKDMLDD